MWDFPPCILCVDVKSIILNFIYNFYSIIKNVFNAMKLGQESKLPLFQSQINNVNEFCVVSKTLKILIHKAASQENRK